MASSEYEPDDVAGLTLWISAFRPAYSAYANGASINRFTNAINSSDTFTAGTVKPIYTNSAIGTNRAFIMQTNVGCVSSSKSIATYVSSNAFTVYWVGTMEPGVNQQHLWYWYVDDENNFRCRFNNGSLVLYHGSTANNGVSTVSFPTLTNGLPWILEFSKSGGDASGHVYIHTNSVQMLDDSTVSTNFNMTESAEVRIPIGADGVNGLKGLLGEFIIYTNILSDDDRFKVRSYLSNAYDL